MILDRNPRQGCAAKNINTYLRNKQTLKNIHKISAEINSGKSEACWKHATSNNTVYNSIFDTTMYKPALSSFFDSL